MRHILLIDDDTAVREGTARQLEEWQFRCLPADSIERALARKKKR